MNTDNNNTGSWERIQSGVSQTERLLGQKKYNESMVRARQTLEYMVKCLCERSGIMEATLIDMIDALYADGVISQTTCEHYHKIRTIGNKAVHEEDNSAYNANQAHHLLSQEVYTFANDYTARRRKPAPRPRAEERSREEASRDDDRRPPRNTASRSSGSTRRRSQRPSGPSMDPASLLKILVPVAVIIILIFVIRAIRPKESDIPETTAPVAVETMPETATEPPTEEPTTAAAVRRYRTNDTLNVRSKASTTAEKVGQLAPGEEVDYIEDVDDTWAKINYNGSEAYVSKQYLDLITE